MNSPLTAPGNLAVDAAGNVFVLDGFYGAVRRIQQAAPPLVVLPGSTGENPATVTNWYQPSAPLSGIVLSDIALDPAGNLFLLSAASGTILKVQPDGSASTLMGNGKDLGWSGDGGPASSAFALRPSGLAVDSQGAVYFADTYYGIIRKIASDGAISTIAGSGLAGSSASDSGDLGPAMAAQMTLPVSASLAVDATGHIYVAEGAAVRVLSPVATGPALQLTLSHTADFTTAGPNLSTLTVANVGGGPASGAVKVILTPAPTVTLSLQGPGWTCTGLACTRSDPLQAHSAYPDITVSQSLSSSTPYVVNTQAAASGGGAPPAFTSDTARVPTLCATSLTTSSLYAFAAGMRNARIVFSLPAGCPWTAASSDSFISFPLPGAGGFGGGSLLFSIAPNPGNARSGTITLNGQFFQIYQLGGSPTAATISSVAHIAAGAGWESTLTLLNTTTQSADVGLRFLDSNAEPLILSGTLPQTASVFRAAAADYTILPSAQLNLKLQQGETPDVQVGSVQTRSSGPVQGFEIFHYNPTGQEAVVPMGIQSRAILAFDNTAPIQTGVAVSASPTSADDRSTVSVQAVVRDDTGAVLNRRTLPLTMGGHTSFVLTDFPETTGKRGAVEFTGPDFTVAGLSVVGLRVNGNALTTLPVLGDNLHTGYGGWMPHIAAGGGWVTIFTLVNAGTSPAPVTLDLLGDSGQPQLFSLTYPQTGVKVTAERADSTLAPGATLVVEARGAAADLVTGSARLRSSGLVGGFAIFRYDPLGQEAVVPLDDQANDYQSQVLVFDNTGGLSTGVALTSVNNINAAAVGGSVTVTIRDEAGKVIQNATLPLPALSHTSFTLTDRWAATKNTRGTVEFAPPPGGRVGVVGIRGTSSNALTTIPVFRK